MFGDHQDYLNLPVIACAIDRKITLTARINNTNYFDILMPDISSKRRIGIFETFESLQPNDFFASALRVVKCYGCLPNVGYTIEFKSAIPINAGVSSSSAMVVAWIHFLLVAFGCKQKLTSQLIAQLAYEAEVLEHNGPGGRMDQYAIALGNIIYIDTSKDSYYKTIGTTLDGLILAESGIPKRTVELLSHVKTNAFKSIEYVKRKHANFDIKSANLDDYQMFSKEVPNELKPYLYAAIKNHLITQQALAVFNKDEKVNPKVIGELMNEHHNVLKNYLNVTVPKIDTMIETALSAGAYGAKIVGSGGGGSIVALCPTDKKQLVIDRLLKVGIKSAYEVSVAQGSKLIPHA